MLREPCGVAKPPPPGRASPPISMVTRDGGGEKGNTGGPRSTSGGSHYHPGPQHPQPHKATPAPSSAAGTLAPQSHAGAPRVPTPCNSALPKGRAPSLPPAAPGMGAGSTAPDPGTVPCYQLERHHGLKNKNKPCGNSCKTSDHGSSITLRRLVTKSHSQWPQVLLLPSWKDLIN